MAATASFSPRTGNSSKGYKDGPNAAGSFGRKSYDWHLGIVEAFATLYDVTGDPQVKARLNELLDIFVNKIIDADIGYGRYYFNDDWSVNDRDGDSKQCEYGLDLEASWLIVEAAQRVGRHRIPKFAAPVSRWSIMHFATALTKNMEAYTAPAPPHEPATNRDMEWWQQCEAMVAFLNSYQLTGDPKYWQAFDLEARFFMDRLVDHQYGEVYTALYPRWKN